MSSPSPAANDAHCNRPLAPRTPTAGVMHACRNGLRVPRAVVEAKLVKAITKRRGVCRAPCRLPQRGAAHPKGTPGAASRKDRALRDAAGETAERDGNLIDAIAAGSLAFSGALAARLAAPRGRHRCRGCRPSPRPTTCCPTLASGSARWSRTCPRRSTVATLGGRGCC
jgi:hypothetical protein